MNGRTLVTLTLTAAGLAWAGQASAAGNERALQRWVRELGSPQRNVRENACRELGRWAHLPPAFEADVRAGLVRLLEDPDSSSAAECGAFGFLDGGPVRQGHPFCPRGDACSNIDRDLSVRLADQAGHLLKALRAARRR